MVDLTTRAGLLAYILLGIRVKRKKRTSKSKKFNQIFFLIINFLF